MKWYYESNGQQNGPVDEGEIRSLIESGVVTDETLIWKAGLSGWVSAGSVEGLYRPPPLPGSNEAKPESIIQAKTPPIQDGVVAGEMQIPPQVATCHTGLGDWRALVADETQVPPQAAIHSTTSPDCRTENAVDAQVGASGHDVLTQSSIGLQKISWKPLAFAFGIHGITIGRSIGLLLGRSIGSNASSARTYGGTVAITVVVAALLGVFLFGGLGFLAAKAINSTSLSRRGKTILAWAVGVVGWFVLLFVAGSSMLLLADNPLPKAERKMTALESPKTSQPENSDQASEAWQPNDNPMPKKGQGLYAYRLGLVGLAEGGSPARAGTLDVEISPKLIERLKSGKEISVQEYQMGKWTEADVYFYWNIEAYPKRIGIGGIIEDVAFGFMRGFPNLLSWIYRAGAAALPDDTSTVQASPTIAEFVQMWGAKTFPTSLDSVLYLGRRRIAAASENVVPVAALMWFVYEFIVAVAQRKARIAGKIIPLRAPWKWIRGAWNWLRW